ncbi:MAG: hypothetical protein WBJ13_11960 [Sedimentibacter sp.]
MDFYKFLQQIDRVKVDNQKCQLVNVDMTGREAEDDGMVCGGIVEVFIEPINFINEAEGVS